MQNEYKHVPLPSQGSATSWPGVCEADAGQPCPGFSYRYHHHRHHHHHHNHHSWPLAGMAQSGSSGLNTVYVHLRGFLSVLLSASGAQLGCEDKTPIDLVIIFRDTSSWYVYHHHHHHFHHPHPSTYFQLRQESNFCDIELYTCEGLENDSPILAHRQELFFFSVCLFVFSVFFVPPGWKLEIFWMNSWRLYVLRAEHDNTLKQSYFCVLQKYAGCSNSLLPCHVHFRPDWKRVWADQVKSLDFASQTSHFCPP